MARNPNTSVLILSGSPIIGNFDFRRRVDFVRIPGVTKLRNGEYTSTSLQVDIDQMVAMRASIIKHTAEALDPDLFIVDKEPLGLRGEVGEPLEMLADRVRFLGQREVEELPPIYAASDVYVWPAIREAYGMAVVEAQAAGLAVVAGNAGGVAEIVRDGETGLLTPEGDAAAFADALRRLLRAPDARADLAAGARRLAVRDHSLEAASGVLDRVLAGLSADAIS